MKTTPELDKWAAVKIGLYTPEHVGVPHWQSFEGAYFVPFTLADAECREAVREHLLIVTDNFDGCWRSWTRTGEFTAITAEGKSIAEAEIACIDTIMKAGL